MIGKSTLLANILLLKDNLSLVGYYLLLIVLLLTCLTVRRKGTILSSTFDGFSSWIIVKN